MKKKKTKKEKLMSGRGGMIQLHINLRTPQATVDS